jgi:hypothetical protein
MEQMPAESLQGRARWALNGSKNVMRLRDNLYCRLGTYSSFH